MKNSNLIATSLLALGLAAAPAAFAQDATTGKAGSTQDTGSQATSWADLDADGNGSLSKAEAQRHQGLASVFDQADSDADGELTADEYRAFVEKQQGAATP
jgi:hypothetical protein